jgi:hypothetical protein
MAAVEGVVLALLESLHGELPSDADRLLSAVSLDGCEQLRARCPRPSARQCWSAPLALPAFGGRPEQGRQALGVLLRAGVRPVSAHSILACPAALNAEIKSSGSKLAVDLLLFERLLLHGGSLARADLHAYCGMVGGIREYRKYFRRLDRFEIETVEEARGRSSYRVAGVGAVSFEVDADARHLPVALASMLGKYVRELAMERQNRFYLQHEPSLGRASGYRDPITARFVARTEALRKRLGIAPDCFER